MPRPSILTPDGLVVATKAGLTRPGPGDWRRDARPERLKECCDASLRRLRLERIDLYQLHAPDPAVPLAESLGALRELQDEGKVRHIGVSNVSADELEQAREVVDVATVQNRYNAADRNSEDVLDACERAGIGFIPGFRSPPAGSPTRAGRWLGIASRQDATPGQVAIAWLLARSPVMLPIPGHLQPRPPRAESCRGGSEARRRGARRDRRRGLIDSGRDG